MGAAACAHQAAGRGRRHQDGSASTRSAAGLPDRLALDCLRADQRGASARGAIAGGEVVVRAGFEPATP